MNESISGFRERVLVSIDGGVVPSKGKPGDAGWDLYVSRDITVGPGCLVDVPTGVRIALPPGVWVHLLGRSSTPRRHGLYVEPAVIDNGYRGELFVQVSSRVPGYVFLKKGMRIAQIVPHRIVEFEWSVTNDLPPSERGITGFGSTGE